MSCPVCRSQQSTKLQIWRERAQLHRCVECRAAHWDVSWEATQVAAYYHDYYAGDTAWNPITEQRYHAVLERLERRVAPGPLLEVGCGTGHFLAVAEQRGWRPLGLEVSSTGVAFLNKLKQERGYTFEVRQADVMQALFAPQQFHAIVMMEVVEHLSDPMSCLARLHAWLAPAGALYLTTPNFDSLSRYLLGDRWRAIGGEHQCLFNPSTMAQTLKGSGFSLDEMVTKNIDIPEILAKWRNPDGDVAASATAAQTEQLRREIERSGALQLAKSALNAALGWLWLGETLEALAVKQPLATVASQTPAVWAPQPCAS
jgi:2-polyprenyl-3-methyl-5-hydroxy-6-metoxy-1,4-benzoquinol methylase